MEINTGSILSRVSIKAARPCFLEIFQPPPATIYLKSRKRFHAELNPDECAASPGSLSSHPSSLPPFPTERDFHPRPLYSLSSEPPSHDIPAPVKDLFVSLGRAPWRLNCRRFSMGTLRRPQPEGKLAWGKPVYIRSRTRHVRKNRATLSRSFEPA